MRHPITIGALGLAALLFGLIALLHLLAARRRTGPRLAWAALCLGLPVLGPLLYFTVGRAQGQFEDDEEEEEEEASVFVPDAYTAPARTPVPAETPSPAPRLATPRLATPRPATPAVPGVPVGDGRTPPTVVPDANMPLPRIMPIRVRAPLPPPERGDR